MEYLIHPNAKLIRSEARGQLKILQHKWYYISNESSSERLIRNEYYKIVEQFKTIERTNMILKHKKEEIRDVHKLNLGVTLQSEKSIRCECNRIIKNKDYVKHLDSRQHLEHKLRRATEDV